MQCLRIFYQVNDRHVLFPFVRRRSRCGKHVLEYDRGDAKDDLVNVKIDLVA